VPLRSLHTFFLFICLFGLASCSSDAVITKTTPQPTRTVPPTTQAGLGFQPSGHGVALPLMIHTAALSNVTQTDFTSMSFPTSEAISSTPALASHPLLTSQTPVKVPPPGSIDPSANTGLFQQGGKPDANGAGGLNNYLETTNPAVAIYTRSGTLQSATTYRSWFNINSAFYDPVAMWDDTGERFIFSALQTGAKSIWLSVAQQSDAMGTYCNYNFPTPPEHDFDKLGVDSDGVYFSFNVLAPGTNNVMSNELFFADRTAMESCQAAKYTDWTGLTNPDGTIAQAITPARQDTSAGGVEYLVNSYPEGACKLTLWTLTSGGTLTNTGAIHGSGMVFSNVENNSGGTIEPVAGILSLQRRRTKSSEVRYTLAESVNRVQGLAATHDLLSHEDVSEARVDDTSGGGLDFAGARVSTGGSCAPGAIACRPRPYSTPASVPQSRPGSEASAADEGASVHPLGGCEGGLYGSRLPSR